jgi:hypothetical protein
MHRLAEQQAADDAADPLPLSGYIDGDTDAADLTKFDPALRCVAAANGEANVFVTGLRAGAPLARSGAVAQQAAEVGLTAAALARHLINSAAIAGGAEERLLPQPPPPVDPLQVNL